MAKHIKRSHNKSLLLYHLVCPVRYRRKVFTEAVTQTFREICNEIQSHFEIHFIEIGTDEDHVHFLIQSVPTTSPQELVQTIKSVTAKEIFRHHPKVKQYLWGGKFWTSGYYINTVGQYANEQVIANYVRNQGNPQKSYERLAHNQPTLFQGLV